MGTFLFITPQKKLGLGLELLGLGLTLSPNSPNSNPNPSHNFSRVGVINRKVPKHVGTFQLQGVSLKYSNIKSHQLKIFKRKIPIF